MAANKVDTNKRGRNLEAYLGCQRTLFRGGPPSRELLADVFACYNGTPTAVPLAVVSMLRTLDLQHETHFAVKAVELQVTARLQPCLVLGHQFLDDPAVLAYTARYQILLDGLAQCRLATEHTVAAGFEYRPIPQYQVDTTRACPTRRLDHTARDEVNLRSPNVARVHPRTS